MDGDKRLGAEAFRCGASGYLLKAWATAELATAVREVLRQIVPVTNSFKRYCQLFAAAWQPSGKRGQTWGSVA